MPQTKLSVLGSHLHDLITLIVNSSDNKMQLHYTHFWNFRELVNYKKQQTSKVQTKHDRFFKAGLPKASASASNSNVSPQWECLDISSRKDDYKGKLSSVLIKFKFCFVF